MNQNGWALIVALAWPLSVPVQAQTNAIGSVAVQDATVSGDLSVTNNRAVLLGNSSVIARDHTAEVTLNRGGTIRVCATSGLHLMQGRTTETHPLMLSLDRGAIEVQTSALASDVIMTPDLRFSLRTAGPLDLSLRVTQNGDTCVENSGKEAPILAISDQFGEASYELHAGQHVLFEHGSLKEVVDNESSPCGCPAFAPATAPGISIGDALLASGSPRTPEQQHPFPAAVSQGLAPAPPTPQAPPHVAHAQVSATLGFNADGTGTIAGTPTTSSSSSVQSPAVSSTPPQTPPSPGFLHRMGHFFKRLFGG